MDNLANLQTFHPGSNPGGAFNSSVQIRSFVLLTHTEYGLQLFLNVPVLDAGGVRKGRRVALLLDVYRSPRVGRHAGEYRC
jgi:hypothetical protein